MKSPNILLVEHWFNEIWNKKNEEIIVEFVHPDCIIHGLADSVTYGVEGFMPMYHAFIQAFPDINMSFEFSETPEKLFVAFVGTATHLGKFGDIEATGRPITVEGVSYCRLKDNQMVEAWNEINFAKLIKQITE